MPEGFQALSFSGICINIFSLVVDDTVTKRIFPPVASHPNFDSLIYWVGQNVLGNLERTYFPLEGPYITAVAWKVTQCLEHSVGCLINGSAINITDWLRKTGAHEWLEH